MIDALRNSYEIEFFRARYNAFYLFSILASEPVRKRRLDEQGVNEEEYKAIKKEEEAKTAEYLVSKNKKETKKQQDPFGSQKIIECISRGDVFINNDRNSEEAKAKLRYQLMKYVALIRHPGLVTPTNDERSMQIAFTARYSSGCISRQVGAVVVGQEGYIRGMGWNDPPEGFIPCLYRTHKELIVCGDKNLFSNYERNIHFIKRIKEEKQKNPALLDNAPFCFKDYQKNIEFDEFLENIEKDKKENIKKHKDKILKFYKNPSRERALHAEENAFLQITKVGGEPVVGGTLYSTAFPCQLCAKKSMQLKIKRIVYIDPYPDIALTHTFGTYGEEVEPPKLEMFSGAIGPAYFKLFAPFLPVKDELKILLEEGEEGKSNGG